ncbi:MAG: SBBP repeat-containing protein [Gammaproteobacteria bacterium]|nr:SBBP repeat-containing protein [Gammaproteobacteria bacterium]
MRRWIWGVLMWSVVGGAGATASALPAHVQSKANGWAMPQFFEQNRGQAGKETQFQAKTSDYLVSIGDAEFTLLPRVAGSQPLRFRFLGAKATGPVKGEQPLRTKVNYFVGKRPADWTRNISTFSQLRQPQIYPGIDLVYRFNAQHQLEYDLLVSPGADPRQIRLQLDDPSPLSLAANGALQVKTPQGVVEHQAPVVFQHKDGKTIPVAARYRLLPGNQLTMTLARYDTARTLVVDPVLKFSSYFGGSDRDVVQGVAWREADGSLYLTGGTSTQADIATNDSYTVVNSGLLSGGQQGTPYQAVSGVEATTCTLNYDPARGNGTVQHFPAYDAFVAKVDLQTGDVLYATYYGGCENEQARDLALDAAGNVYIVGTTKSTDLPTNGIQSQLTPTSPGSNTYEVDAFVAKFDTNGQLVYGRYVGGSADDYGRAIKVDIEGYAYIVGNTSSPYMISAQGQFTCFGRVDPGFEGDSCYQGQTDAFMARIHPSGTVTTHGTYIGGYGTDWAADLVLSNATGAAVKIYVAGTTAATMADPNDPAYRHGFPLKDGRPPYKYYVPGNCGDSGVDFVNDKHPCRDGFVVVMDSMGEQLLYTTMIGGAGDDVVTGVAVDTTNNIYLTGYSTSEGAIVGPAGPGNIENPKLIATDPDREIFVRFPLVNQVWNSSGLETNVSFYDGTAPKAFLTKFDAVAGYDSVQFSTFVGGSDVDKATGVVVHTVQTLENGMSVKKNNIYLVGQTLSQDFKPMSDAFKSAADSEDIFLIKMEQNESADPAATKNPRTRYATLLGAEGLDSPKAMALVVEAGINKGVVIVGKTSSRRFPTTANATNPNAIGGPDDGFITYVTDETFSTNLKLTPAGYRLPVNVGDLAEFVYQVTNEGSLPAEQVRVSINLPPSVIVTNRPSTCLLEDKRILFCDLGTLDAVGGLNSNTVSFGFKPLVGGVLRVRVSVLSNLVDANLDDSSVQTTMRVAEPEYYATARLQTGFILLLGLLLLITRTLLKPRSV